jgi:hypothetical protein
MFASLLMGATGLPHSAGPTSCCLLDEQRCHTITGPTNGNIAESECDYNIGHLRDIQISLRRVGLEPNIAGAQI